MSWVATDREVMQSEPLYRLSDGAAAMHDAVPADTLTG